MHQLHVHMVTTHSLTPCIQLHRSIKRYKAYKYVYSIDLVRETLHLFNLCIYAIYELVTHTHIQQRAACCCGWGIRWKWSERVWSTRLRLRSGDDRMTGMSVPSRSSSREVPLEVPLKEFLWRSSSQEAPLSIRTSSLDGKNGMEMAPIWNGTGSYMEWKWIQYGKEIVPVWNRDGSFTSAFSINSCTLFENFCFSF